MSKPDIVTVPCFSGAPWDLEKLEPLSDFPLHTMRLPEGEDSMTVVTVVLLPDPFAGCYLRCDVLFMGPFRHS